MGKQINIFDIIEESGKVDKALKFVKMGCNYEVTDTDDIGNYRITSKFQNNEGITYFVEITSSKHNDRFKCNFYFSASYNITLRECNYAKRDKLDLELKSVNGKSDRYMDIINEINEIKQSRYINCFGLEYDFERFTEDFKTDNILKIVNETFNCSFTELILK